MAHEMPLSRYFGSLSSSILTLYSSMSGGEDWTVSRGRIGGLNDTGTIQGSGIMARTTRGFDQCFFIQVTSWFRAALVSQLRRVTLRAIFSTRYFHVLEMLPWPYQHLGLFYSSDVSEQDLDLLPSRSPASALHCCQSMCFFAIQSHWLSVHVNTPCGRGCYSSSS